mmetsp:Transcript_15751/g.29444  ORF Transcript_15751/g.29444 Transcript_15751/m.29444 type:complete len:201 (+) Transcript_15751:2949-3551(+)
MSNSIFCSDTAACCLLTSSSFASSSFMRAMYFAFSSDSEAEVSASRSSRASFWSFRVFWVEASCFSFVLMRTARPAAFIFSLARSELLAESLSVVEERIAAVESRDCFRAELEDSASLSFISSCFNFLRVSSSGPVATAGVAAAAAAAFLLFSAVLIASSSFFSMTLFFLISSLFSFLLAASALLRSLKGAIVAEGSGWL